MQPDRTVDLALHLSWLGVLDRENALISGVTVETVRRWRRRFRQAGSPRSRAEPRCPRCHGSSLDERSYAYLLGLYLGDGHITHFPRGVDALSITCDNTWPALMDETITALKSVAPTSSPFRIARTGATEIKSYSKHWLCLFPQHGPGRKHARRIVLEPWQAEIVAVHTKPFLRGLFHSDGCRITNWTRRVVRGEPKRYEYPRYFFSNESADILRLCTDALDRLGIAWRLPRRNMLSVARREAVVALDAFIGPKR